MDSGKLPVDFENDSDCQMVNLKMNERNLKVVNGRQIK